MVSGLGDSIAVLTDSDARGFFADQFENKSNYDAHFDGTGPEVWRQTNGSVKAFVSGAGLSPSLCDSVFKLIPTARHGRDHRRRRAFPQVDGGRRDNLSR